MSAVLHYNTLCYAKLRITGISGGLDGTPYAHRIRTDTGPVGNSLAVSCVEFLMKSLREVAELEDEQDQLQGEHHAEKRI